ncbi:universal stress protein [Streptomyces ipomoeae]|jgi:nucleotide-binding universal stress UspA family protein|uniref:Universal stress protein n=4 Tax=Streptomyces ipomoeae TaxID=103232 RepID=A0AAE8W1T2_9ACTN|nr:universal stress protein [Streptomyces ipomoeae]MDX2695780.1 universal stress protein [Streptomyces ipomoeae]MDX2820339.1 universal stress protein [Streptomyces ipomoeae]MDX2844676.1 universal stress protein [Streptomyces ipomoeae]TQE27534.1 universal stress protein [Streptomyces ipomoeae]TQE30458.1 universal stress protein [Streptomyces ipomoeae]
MPRTVTVGLDGSTESLAATEWAAREARLRGLPLRLVNVWELVPEPMGRAPTPDTGTRRDPSEPGRPGTGPGRLLRERSDGIRLRHPGVDVTLEQRTGRPTDELVAAAEDAELLVLGSRGLSGIAGFLLGSVGLHVVAHTERPVVLVRARERAADEHTPAPSGTPSAATPFCPVVLGLDTAHPDDTLIRFAFDAAARRETALRVVHDWNPPPYFASGPREVPEPDPDLYIDLDEDLRRRTAAALTTELRPYRQEFPAVEVIEEARPGKPADHLIDASHDSSLLVVGRRIRHSPLGPHIGPVTHAVLHHAAAPVAVVAHG